MLLVVLYVAVITSLLDENEGGPRAALMICKWTYSHTHTDRHYQHRKRLRFGLYLRMASQTQMDDNRNCRKLRRCWRLGYGRTRDRQAGRQGAIKSGAEIS